MAARAVSSAQFRQTALVGTSSSAVFSLSALLSYGGETTPAVRRWRSGGGGSKLIAVVKVVLLVPEQNATTLTQSSEEKPHKSKDAP